MYIPKVNDIVILSLYTFIPFDQNAIPSNPELLHYFEAFLYHIPTDLAFASGNFSNTASMVSALVLPCLTSSNVKAFLVPENIPDSVLSLLTLVFFNPFTFLVVIVSPSSSLSPIYPSLSIGRIIVLSLI